MYELSLFSGAGGGLLATKWLLGWTCVGYVEIDDYCQQVLAQRIKDGLLDNAPIYSDIGTFIDEGYAKEYEGMVDVITGGFPCQPFSAAGKNKGEHDSRNQWPNTLKTISVVRPKFIYLENVPNLLVHEYVRTIFGNLAEIGYDARWDCISAQNCGANHKRLRWWLVAYTGSQQHERNSKKKQWKTAS
jgi:DNA (cytosine-5)-methyltransferase 1